MDEKSFFVRNILNWSKIVTRDLPWKSTNDPYKIWLSEIILQQTRVAQGRPYYLKFVDKYPTVFDFASASEDEILGLWKGLGYYSRARSMHVTAKTVVSEYQGVFPEEYDDMIKLKGIGSYTAAAILSFSHNAPFAVVDGNVIRVLTRYFGMQEAVDNAKAKKKIQKIADDLLPKGKAALYNQAIMDFGATFCTPKKVDCHECTLKTKCVAFEKQIVNEVPVKIKKIKKKERFFHFLLLENDDKILMQKRDGKDIWKGLFQLPKIEVLSLPCTFEDTSFIIDTDFSEIDSLQFIEKRIQLLTHQKINAYFWKVHLNTNNLQLQNYSWIDKTNLNKIGLPRIIDLFLSKYLLSLK